MFSNQIWGYSLAVLLSLGHINPQSQATFSTPDSLLLFGTYGELRIATPSRVQALRPLGEVAANQGYFVYPSISPRGDLLAWGFAKELQTERTEHRARFALGVFSLREEKWKTYGDFDDIGATAFSGDGSKIAFVAEQRNKKELLILDVLKGTITNAPYPRGMPESASLSWSPDETQLAIEIQRGEKNPIVAILDLKTGNVQALGEGVNPTWSPTGEWISYYDPAGAKCLLVHPDRTGLKVTKKLSQSIISYRRFGWGGPVWSPDGKRLLVNEIKGDGPHLDVVLLDLESGESTTKLKNGLPAFGWVAGRQ